MTDNWENHLHPHEREELRDIRIQRTVSAEEVRALHARERKLYDRARKRILAAKKENTDGDR